MQELTPEQIAAINESVKRISDAFLQLRATAIEALENASKAIAKFADEWRETIQQAAADQEELEQRSDLCKHGMPFTIRCTQCSQEQAGWD